MKHNSNFFELYLATKKQHYTPLASSVWFYAMKHNSNFLERYVAPKNTTILHSPAPYDFTLWNIIQTFLNDICRRKIPLFVDKKYHYPPCSPRCYFFAMKHNSNFFERYVAPKKQHYTPCSSFCYFFAMNHNSNFFERYLSSKNTTILRVPLFAIFSLWNMLLFSAMKSNSNFFELYLATKKHHHTPLLNFQFSGACNIEQLHAM